jgi:APA family basic amino acid/polyamine antiporter
MTTEGDGSGKPSHQIGLVSCVAFCVGAMIGGGVFTLSGLAVDRAGPAALAAYLIAGFVMLLSALSFVAVSSRSKEGDSGYAPLGEILSPAWRFVVMWGFYLNAVVLAAFVLISFGAYLNQYFIKSLDPTAAALLAVLAVALLNLGPADVVGKAETYLVAMKVGVLVLLVGFGLAYIGQADFTPFMPNGASSLLGTTAMLFTAYTGFNVVTNIAGSVRNPKRTVPRAIVISIAISGTVYAGVIIAMLASGLSNFGEAGLARAAAQLMGSWGQPLVALAACVSTLTAANAQILGASELVIRLTAQGDIPPRAGRLSKRGHPVFSVLLASSIAALLIVFAKGGTLIVNISNVTAIFAMLVVDAGAFRLALRKWPGEGIKLPGGVLIPSVGFVVAALQLPSLGLKAVLVGLAMTLVGYVMFALRHQTWLAGDVHELERRIKALETPLSRALRRMIGAERQGIAVHE